MNFFYKIYDALCDIFEYIFHWRHGMDHTVLPAITPMPAFIS